MRITSCLVRSLYSRLECTFCFKSVFLLQCFVLLGFWTQCLTLSIALLYSIFLISLLESFPALTSTGSCMELLSSGGFALCPVPARFTTSLTGKTHCQQPDPSQLPPSFSRFWSGSFPNPTPLHPTPVSLLSGLVGTPQIHFRLYYQNGT